MPHLLPRRRPRGTGFLVGGTLVAATLLLVGMVAGIFDIHIGGAPQVRIESSATVGN